MAAAVALASTVIAPQPAQAVGLNFDGLSQVRKRLVSGAFATALGPTPGAGTSRLAVGAGDDNGGVEASTVPPAQLNAAGAPSNYQPAVGGAPACATRLGSNVKVNQNCENLTDADLQGRGQAQNETSIAHDPSQPDHLLASYNDYRRGDGNCYGAYSLDGGKSWNDTTIPTGFTRGQPTFGAPREYWQAGGGHLGRVRHQGQRLLQLPGVQPGGRRLAEPGPVKRFLRLSLDRQRRCVMEFPRPAGG